MTSPARGAPQFLHQTDRTPARQYERACHDQSPRPEERRLRRRVSKDAPVGTIAAIWIILRDAMLRIAPQDEEGRGRSADGWLGGYRRPAAISREGL